MSLPAGARIGPYQVVAQIGVGGMGEVYRARDTRLDRDVAIKVLPDSFVTDAERVARFQREAKTLASLNHPNIGSIHGLEESNGVTALVLELVEGPTLADRIAQGPIPQDEALPIAQQIAQALEAAHAQGIIHRDLKPANVKVRADGAVKVLDFGLAKALIGDGAGSAPHLSHSPTITSPAIMTGMGVILGTAAYMAPEQARGKVVDKRADLWAFGCVVYEMLTGRRPFDGEEVTDVLARVIEREPDMAALPPATPPAIRRLLRRCLEKDRKRRLADASDARLEIDEALISPTPESAVATMPPRGLRLWQKAAIASAVILLALSAGYVGWTLKLVPQSPVTRFVVPISGEAFTGLALSPDGRRLAYVADNHLYLRSFDRLEPQVIGGTEGLPQGPRSLFFSPDGEWVGYWEAGQIKKVRTSGGAAVPVWNPEQAAAPPSGVTWSSNHTILIGYGARGILQVPDEGGAETSLITLDTGERASRPQLLPDGRTVLFTVTRSASWDDGQIVAQSLDTGVRKTLVTGGTDARYVPTGHLFYMFRESVRVVPFDVKSLTLAGAEVTAVDRVSRPLGPQAAGGLFSVASTGTLAYLPASGAGPPRRTLVWVDATGHEEALRAPVREYFHARLSPDDSRVALDIPDEHRNYDIWLWDVAHGGLDRVISDPSADLQPIWTRDGQRLIFSSMRKGVRHLFWQAANPTAPAEQLVDGNGQVIIPYTLSPNDDLIFRGARDAGSDLLMANIGNRRTAGSPSVPVAEQKLLIPTPYEEINAEISPDGRWLAYQSNSSGSNEVYVRPFPDVDREPRTVSVGGGTEPLWSRDGRQLYYRSTDGGVMAVPVAGGPQWVARAPTKLFEGPSYPLGSTAGVVPFISRTYDVSRKGRFLMIKNVDPPAQTPPPAPPIVVVLNWVFELNRLVPTK